MTTDRRILFYAVGDAWGAFSNFSAHPIQLDGVLWPTSEHFFQAQKFEDPAHQAAVLHAPTPMKAALEGRDRAKTLRADWETVKVDVMRRALRAKFTQHPDLGALLLSTGDAELVEHTANDAFWADGGDGRGQNMLGRLLVELREDLRAGRA
jgi:ribA/ribD-fused uncharacterized protein